MQNEDKFHSQNLLNFKESGKLIKANSQIFENQKIKKSKNLDNINLLEIYEDILKKNNKKSIEKQQHIITAIKKREKVINMMKQQQNITTNNITKLPRISRINNIAQKKRQISIQYREVPQSSTSPVQQKNLTQKFLTKRKILFNDQMPVQVKNAYLKKIVRQQSKKRSNSVIKLLSNQQQTTLNQKTPKIKKTLDETPKLVIVHQRSRTLQPQSQQLRFNNFEKSPQKIIPKSELSLHQKDQAISKQIKLIKVPRKLTWKDIKLQLGLLEQKQFYNLMRTYNHLVVGQNHQGNYKAYVGRGNNSTLIKKHLKLRGYWTIVDDVHDSNLNFVWTQTKNNQFSQKLEPRQYIQINEQQALCSIKFNEKLVKDFIKHKKNDYYFLENVSNLMIQPIFEKYVSNLINHNLRRKRKKVESEKISQFIESKRKKFLKKQLKNPHQIKLHNHIDSASSLGNKKGLFFYIKKYYQLTNRNPFDIIPETIHIVSNQNKFTQQQLKQKIYFGLPCILKPGQVTNRGTGITIHNSWTTLLQAINKSPRHSNGDQRTHIVQKYIMPFLYHFRKFDIRMWVLRSGKQVWFFKQGYIRTSSKQFNIKSTNKFVHLTNDAIQKYSEDYGKYEAGNKISFNQFQKYLDYSSNTRFNFWQSAYPEIKKITHQVFKIGNFTMDNQNKIFGYQLFGLDFMIDQNFKVWLIEVNTNPCLQTSCLLLTRLITNMIQNVFNIALDPIFPPPQNWKRKSNWSLQGFKFQLLYDGLDEEQNGVSFNDMKKFETEQDEFQEKVQQK